MFKRISATVILALIILGVPAVTSASHDNQNEEERTPRRDIIWQGLCVGASLDLSRASQERCTRTAHSGDERQRNKYDYKHDKHHYDYEDHKKDHEADRKEKDKYRHEYDYRDRRDSHDYRDRHSHDYRNQPTTPAPVQYAALGDSIAAGLGLESSAGSDTRCGRSHNSYANIVAEQRGLELAHIACSGADMGDLTTQQRIIGPNPPPQLETAFAGGTPKLITITAGANDTRWAYFLRKCYTRTCGTNTDQRIADSLLTNLNTKTQRALHDIERRSSESPPETIVTGYYNPLEGCSGVEPRITSDELAWLESQTEALNDTLRNASNQFNFVTFVPISFSGHSICSSDPWVQTLDDSAPFHPTYEGQQAIARQIL